MAELGREGVSLQRQLVAGPAHGTAPSTSAASTSTSASSMPCSGRASSRWSTCSTGTCRRRCRTAAASPTREVVGWFADYAALLASSLGDRVTDWMTFNEPAVFAFLGHADGIHAPGCATGRPRSASPTTNCAPMPPPPRRSARSSTARGSASRSTSTRSRRRPIRSAIESPPTSGAPRATRGSSIRCSAVATRRWASRRTARRVTSRASTSAIRRPGDLDYLGLNYYRRDCVSARSDRAFDWTIGAAPGSEQTQMGWHVAPDGLRDALLDLHRDVRTARDRGHRERRRVPGHRRPGRPRSATGPAALPGAPRRGGRRCARAGVPLTGYHVWSLLDNYEWSLGYSRRFGLVHVDFASQRRTPKDSARWYQRLIAARSSCHAAGARSGLTEPARIPRTNARCSARKTHAAARSSS